MSLIVGGMAGGMVPRGFQNTVEVMWACIIFTSFIQTLISHQVPWKTHTTIEQCLMSLTVGSLAGGIVPRVLENTVGRTVLTRNSGICGCCLGCSPGLTNPQFRREFFDF